MHGYALAVVDEEAERVGDIELALGVVRLEPVEHRPELLGAEDVDAGVDLAQLELLGGGVRRFDDAREVARRVAHDAAVGARVVRLEREHGRRGPLASVRLDSARTVSGVSAGTSPFRTRTSPPPSASASRAERTASPVPSGLLLHRDLDALERVGAVGRRDDDDRGRRPRRARRR